MSCSLPPYFLLRACYCFVHIPFFPSFWDMKRCLFQAEQGDAAHTTTSLSFEHVPHESALQASKHCCCCVATHVSRKQYLSDILGLFVKLCPSCKVFRWCQHVIRFCAAAALQLVLPSELLFNICIAMIQGWISCSSPYNGLIRRSKQDTSRNTLGC